MTGYPPADLRTAVGNDSPHSTVPFPAFTGLPHLPAIDELREHRQWVAWKEEVRPGSAKPTKPPINPHTGRYASHSAPADWGTYDQAEARAIKDGLPGVGYVLTEADDLTGLDLDNCVREDSTIEPWAAEIVKLAETYTELSPSGRGLRMLVRGKVERTIKADAVGVEIYRASRYLTITGRHVAGTPTAIRPAPKTLAALQARARRTKPAYSVAAIPGRQRPWQVPGPQSGQRSDFIRNVNTAALQNLGHWVLKIFPSAKPQPATGAWRVSSRDLGRDLQEDLSLHPDGIVDFGIADMGDDRNGRRYPTDLVLEYVPGMENAKTAALWLCERLDVSPGQMGFREPDPLGVAVAEAAVARLAAQTKEVEAYDSETGEVIEAELLPPLDFAIGGLGTRIADWVYETAPRPSKEFAFLPAIGLLAAIFGRRFTTPTYAPVNLYMVGIGVSGSGKDHALKTVRHLLYETGLDCLLGPGDFSSDSALELALRRNPCCIAQIDELGVFLQGVSNIRSGSHEQRIRKAFLELYSLGVSAWSGKQTADKEKAMNAIWYPTFSFIGFSTPSEFYDGIAERNLKDGFLARPVFVTLNKRPPRPRHPALDVPPDLMQLVRQAASWSPPGTAAPIRASLIKTKLTSVPFADEAASVAYDELSAWQEAEMDRRPEADGLINRAAENAVRMATLRALSRMCIDPEYPPELGSARVTVEDVRWAEAIVRHSLDSIRAGITANMASSDFQRLCKAIRQAVDKAGVSGIPNSKLIQAKGVATFDSLVRKRAIDWCIEAEWIVARESTTGRPGVRYFRLVPSNIDDTD